MTFSDSVIQYFSTLDTDWKLPKGFELIKPYQRPESMDVFCRFYNKYFSDSNERVLILGINPGRFGAGVTGIPFTDPVILNENCQISNAMHQRHELSAIYVYKFIEAFGSIEDFYSKFYINSVCPLGFLTNGINCNYYDDKALYQSVEDRIIEGLKAQVDFGCRRDVVISLGTGQNVKFLKKINDKIGLFKEVKAIPHPRWVMQYRRKRMQEFIDQAIELFNDCLNT